MTNQLGTLGQEFGVAIADNFAKRAIYFHNMDWLEYLSSDQIVVADRVDKWLTILWDKNLQNIVGFKLKGFHAIFKQYVLPRKDVNPEDFQPIVRCLEVAFTCVGDRLFPKIDVLRDEARKTAYKNVIQFVKAEKVDLSFDESEVLAAA